MKRTIATALLTAIALTISTVGAQDRPSDTKSSMAKGGPMQGGMSKTDMDKQMGQMDDQMKKMQEQMTRIQKTPDPKERQKLMREHLETMRVGMGVGRGPVGAMAGGMAGDATKAPDAQMWKDMQQRQGYTEKRMHMMQMMMDHMMQMMQSEPAK
jgi:hypothetical protein